MTSLSPEVYAARIASIQDRIDGACREANRSPDDVTLIVVSKFHPAEVVRALYAAGVKDFGENRHQEAMQKAADVEDLDLRWHFVGQLQTKKARQAARYAHAIHSIDRIGLVDALAKLDSPDGEPFGRTLDAFIQVNMTADEGRGGVEPSDLEALAERVLETPVLALRGIMAVAPLGEEPAAAFERLRSYSDRLRTVSPAATDISAGMTHDFEEALLHGATHLRIGTAITGKRPEPN